MYGRIYRIQPVGKDGYGRHTGMYGRTVGGYVYAIGKTAHDDYVIELFCKGVDKIHYKIQAIGCCMACAYNTYYF